MKLSATEIEKELEQLIKNFDGKATELIPLCGALTLINRLKAENKNCGVKIQNQREQLRACNEKIKRLEVDNEKLKRLEFQADALNEAYEESVREALKKVAEQVNQIICENCYPDFNAKGKPVNVFNAVNGYKAIDNLFKKEMGCGE